MRGVSCLFAASFFLAASVSAQEPERAQVVENTPSLCQNGEDDDGDGLVDCDDDGCAQLIFCVSRPTTEVCDDGDDDDGDGLVDCDDDDCRAACSLSIPIDGQPGTRGIYQPRIVDEESPPDVGFLEHDDPRRYPRRAARRPQTYLRGMMVPQLGVAIARYDRFSDRYLAQLGVGLTYGIFDFWQVTALLPVLRMEPSVDFENPALSTTLRVFEHEVVELSLYANLSWPIDRANTLGDPEPLPTHHLLARSRFSNVTHLDGGFLMRIHAGEWVRLDVGLPLVTAVFDDPVRGDMTMDLRALFSLGDHVWIGAFTGVVLPGPNLDTPNVPFGFFAGATIPGPSSRGPLMDLALRFGWPVFYDGAPPSGEPGVDAEFWQITFDARVFTYLLP